MHKHELHIRSAQLEAYVITYVHDLRLIMLHSTELSMQWPVNGVGVLLRNSGQGSAFQLGFMSNTDPQSYQSFYLHYESYTKVYDFFKRLGFPLHGAIVPDEYKESAG